MIENFLSLSNRPFRPSGDPSSYVPSASAEASRQRLVQCIERREGIGLLTGPVGTGKTLLLSVLAEDLSERVAIAHLKGGALRTRRAFLQFLLYELGLPYRDKDEGELRLSVLDYLQSAESAHRGLLLLVDEAQALPIRLLEEVRMATNLTAGSGAGVQAVLAGSPQLEERLASPKLAALEQRIAARCYLAPLDFEETQQYLATQLKSCGGERASFFSDDAVQTIWQHTEGVCRLINQLCDQALLLSAASGIMPLNAEAITEAWSDLQQLPYTNTTASSGGEGPSIIEFGSLSEDENDPPSALAPVEAIEDIQRQLADVEQAEAASEGNEPAGPLQEEGLAVFAEHPHEQLHPHLHHTEVELRVGDLAEPFGKGFEDEETVIDPYARPAGASGREKGQRPQKRRYADEEQGAPAGRGIPQIESMPLIVNTQQATGTDPVFPAAETEPAAGEAALGGEGPFQQPPHGARQYRRLFSQIRHHR